MKLTDKQERLIARYIRAVGDRMGAASAASREQALAQVRARIAQRLQRLHATSVADADLMAALQQLGSPADVAADLARDRPSMRRFRLAPEEAVWLGVCAGAARYLNVGAREVRVVAVFLGATGPLAVAVYLALYFAMYYAERADGAAPKPPAIDWTRLALQVAGTTGAALALHFGTRMLLFLMNQVYLRVAGRDALPALGRWAWLDDNQGFFLFWALVFLMPVAALGALPMAHGWDETARRGVQAGLAVYALMLCMGIASHLVGVLLIAGRFLAL